MPPTFAIVIPTYDRSDLLGRTLAAIAALEGEGADVVVVDDGSEPRHAQRNEAICAEHGVRCLRQANAGPAVARNAGIRATESDLVAFLDDDCAPAQDWLVRLAGAFEATDATLGGVGGRVRSEPPHNWVSAYCSAAQYSSGEQPTFTNAATANACFRRSVLDELGGFDEGFRHPGGDDPDLSRRVREAGYRLEYVPEAVVYHAELDTFGDFFKHLWHRGLGEARGKLKEGRTSRVVLRATLFPAFCARRAAQTWRVSAGKAGAATRLAYAGLEAVAAAVFVAGSVAGLLQRGRY